MHFRPKTIRRVLILGVLLLAIGGVAFAAWAANARQSAARIARARENAMAAYAKGDYAGALPHFSTYLTESKTADQGPEAADAEALLAYGKSRQAVPLPRAGHIRESINIFERYLELRPGDREAQHQLLALYPEVKYNEEALKWAAIVLAEDPADTHALLAKAKALANQRKFRESLDVAEQLVVLRPLDLTAHRWVQAMLFRLNTPGEQIVARFDKLLRAHPDEARFELLLARAHHLANQPDEAAKLLKSAAGRKTIDPELATELAAMLEHREYRMFRESNAVLERLATDDADASHVRPLVRRLWQGGRYREVLKRTESQDLSSPAADTDLLAFRALALYDLNRPADSAAVVDALAARTDDMAAGAWAAALRARADENLAPLERVKQYNAALDRTPDNEVIHFLLGEAYVGLGETELAVREWVVAAYQAPSWAAPTAAIARTLAMTGRSAEALSMAREALKRAPGALSTATGYVVALFADLQQNPDPAARKKLLDHVTKVQARFPREPETLHIHAALLSRTGDRVKAESVLRSALDAKNPASRDTLLQLAAVSFTERLGLEQEVLDFAARMHGLTPAVAVRQALLLSQAGKPQDGRKLLEAAQARDKKSDPTLWAVALLQYRESTGDPTVLADWVKLGDANPDNMRVQHAILQAPARVNDKEFWINTIERLTKLTGEDAVMPRVERARWLLSGDRGEKDAEKDTTAAISLLRAVGGVATSRPEIHRLLGLAFEKNAAQKTGSKRDGLLQEAAAELEKAFEARDADPAVATDLTRVYRAMGRSSDADRVMSRVAGRAADLGLEGRIKTARTLVAQGQIRMAVGVLELIEDGQDPTRDAMLCGLYRRTGANDKAAALYRKAADNQRAEPALLAEGADFFARAGKFAEAERLLDKLRSMDVGGPGRTLLLARYAERHQTPEKALAGFEAAVAADPAHPAAWQGLVGFYLRRLRFADAVAAADRGLTSIPDDPDLRSLRTRAVAMLGYQNDPNIETLADQLSEDPQSAAIADMLRILGEAKRTGEPLEQTLPKLRELADRNPQLLRLQMYVAQAHARLKQYDEAERVAARAVQRAPNEPDPARLLTAVYAARPGDAKWPKVLDAARRWRQCSTDNPLPADITIAQTLLEMGQASDAAEQLGPYVAAPLKPDANPAVVGLCARALIRSGREQKAADLLTPLAKANPAWRKLWLELGQTSYDNANEAIRWVERVAPLLSDDAAERAALGEAWVAIGVRFSSEAALAKAKLIIEPLTKEPEAGAEAWRVLSMLSEATGDMGQAVSAYRELLKTQPDSPDLQNNLAYALLALGRERDLAEARELAEQAVKKTPKNSTYLDTLARVYRTAGDLPAAEQTFRQALEAEQNSLDALIGLADLHARAGQLDKARELLKRINRVLRGGEMKLSAALQRELEGVRDSIKAPTQSSRAK